MVKLILFFFTSVSITSVFGQTTIVVPTFDDKYSNYVKQLESGETDINYQDFRFSFIESAQFIIANKESDKMDSLKNLMYDNMNTKSYNNVIIITQQILSIDYTDMLAHKILRQTYGIIGDTINAVKYKTIQFGLLNSIVKNGDGEKCATAWPVIQVEEEYFILSMIDARVTQQTLVSKGGLCDKMDVTENGKKKTYYFDTTKVFEGYKKLGIR